MQPSEIIARMSRDPRLDAFRAENKEHLFKEYLWKILHEAELIVSKDLKIPVAEQDITLSSATRAVNLPDDFLSMVEARYKISTADALLEGNIIDIVASSDLL